MMRRIIFISILILITKAITFAQDDNKLLGFKAIILPEYSSYFSNATYTEGGKLQLNATQKYINTNQENKNAILFQIFSGWQDSLILVSYESKRELWGLSTEKGKVKLIDHWDYSLRATTSPTATPLPTSRPWFFYVGAQIGGDNQSNLNVAINLRIGFFLLKNRWDMATTFSGGISGNIKPTTYGTPSSQGWSNFGLMSRVHFPIKRTGFSPNLGAEITMSKFGSSEAEINPAFVIGFSWFVGIGSIDIGVKVSEFTTGMGGYTMYPSAKK